MSPEVDQILKISASQLAGIIAPMLPEGYAQGQASLLSFMLMMSAQEYDRAADIRVKENDDMRALFGACAPSIADASLRTELEAAATTRDETLAISALNGSNAKLRTLLIRLQTELESQGNKQGQERVWGVLKRMAERRLVKFA